MTSSRTRSDATAADAEADETTGSEPADVDSEETGGTASTGAATEAAGDGDETTAPEPADVEGDGAAGIADGALPVGGDGEESGGAATIGTAAASEAEGDGDGATGSATAAGVTEGAVRPVPEPDTPGAGTEAGAAGAGGAAEVGEAEAADAEAAGAVEAVETAVAARRAVRTRELRPDEVAALEEQRDFLLRSLDDLEQEHEAGDVDEHDHTALRDDYTARAARVIRALEAHQARVAAPRSSRARWRTLVTVAGVVLFALGAGVLVAQAAGRRQSGDSVTGNIRESARQQIDSAVDVAAGGDFAGAIDQLDAVLDDDPDNVEALSWKGWFQYRSGDAGSMETLTNAVETDPEYPTTHAFLAVILRDLGRPDYALRELERLDELDPPTEVQQMVAPLREELEASQASTSTTPTTEPAG